jgi:YHS domain-containing protein
MLVAVSAAIMFAADTAKKVKDPVCGMELEPKAAAAKSQYDGKTYYFCTKEEKAEFDKSPTKYVKAATKPKKTS